MCGNGAHLMAKHAGMQGFLRIFGLSGNCGKWEVLAHGHHDAQTGGAARDGVG